MAFKSKYTGAEIEERLDRIEGIPNLISELLTSKDFVTKEDLTCILKNYAPADYKTIPIDNVTIYWDNNILKARGSDGSSLWELRENKNGEQFLYSSLPVVTKFGITTYSDADAADMIADLWLDIPIDNDTIYWYTDENGIKVLKAKSEGGGGGSSEVLEELSKLFRGHFDNTGNLLFIEAMSDIAINGGMTLYYDNGTGDLPTIFDGIPIDETSIIWTEKVEEDGSVKKVLSSRGLDKEQLQKFLDEEGYIKGSIDLSNYATIKWTIDNFTSKEYLIEELKNYVDKYNKQDITGEKNFTGGLKVNGSPIVYDATNKYWKLEGDLLVTGGISMFGSDSAFKPSTIMDAIATDGVNLKVVDGVLTFVGASGGLSEVHWDDVIGRPTLLSSFIDDVVQGNYLPLSGGNVIGQIGYNFDKGGNIPASGVISYSNATDFTTKKSFIGNGQNTANGNWYNLISVRADNGNDKFGMYIGCPMTDYQGSLFWNRQEGYEGAWQGERIILDSVNWSQFVTAADGGNYLPLSGGTISSSSASPLVLNSNATECGIRFGLGGNTRGWIGFSPTYGVTLYNYFSGTYGISLNDNGNVLLCQDGNGNVGIGKNSTDCRLDVAGDIATNNYLRIKAWPGYGNGSCTIWFDGTPNIAYISSNILVSGGITMYSDKRKKTILNNVELTLQQIADAPLIEHYYNSDTNKTTHVGSIAQYWYGLNDWFCKEDSEGFLTMEIQNAALASAISVARELMRYESKTDKKIRLLKKRVSELEDEIEKLKERIIWQ